MKKVYFISGLGADRRVFSFLDLGFCEPVFIDWIKPEKKETLQSYALRLRSLIPEEAPVIVGISFGGMLATEIAKADAATTAILLASSKTSGEIPGYLRAVRFFPFYKWLPAPLLRHSSWVVKFITGKNAPKQKKLILDIIRDSDMNFVKWAMTAIVHWQNRIIPQNVVHIHGTADRILPYSRVKADYTVAGGSHVLTLDQSEEISALLKMLVESGVPCPRRG